MPQCSHIYVACGKICFNFKKWSKKLNCEKEIEVQDMCEKILIYFNVWLEN